MTTIKDGVEVREISPEDGWEVLDRAAHKELGMSAKDFLAAWESGKFDNEADRPEIMRVVMLLPLLRTK
jgi:hypothetical protein